MSRKIKRFNSVRYKIKVVPNSKKPSVTEEGERLKVRVNASPEKGKANERLLEMLAEYLKVPKQNIKIISGHTSHNKIVEVEA